MFFGPRMKKSRVIIRGDLVVYEEGLTIQLPKPCYLVLRVQRLKKCLYKGVERPSAGLIVISMISQLGHNIDVDGVLLLS